MRLPPDSASVALSMSISLSSGENGLVSGLTMNSHSRAAAEPVTAPGR